jgi:hypothetical protein
MYGNSLLHSQAEYVLVDIRPHLTSKLYEPYLWTGVLKQSVSFLTPSCLHCKLPYATIYNVNIPSVVV